MKIITNKSKWLILIMSLIVVTIICIISKWEGDVEILYALPGMWFFACILVDFDEDNNESTLTDATTTSITIGDSVMNKSIVVEYECIRAGSVQIGEVSVIHKEGTLIVTPRFYDGDDIGLTFSGAQYTASDEIQLNCLLSSTGNNAVFKYDIYRKLKQ